MLLNGRLSIGMGCIEVQHVDRAVGDRKPILRYPFAHGIATCRFELERSPRGGAVGPLPSIEERHIRVFLQQFTESPLYQCADFVARVAANVAKNAVKGFVL